MQQREEERDLMGEDGGKRFRGLSIALEATALSDLKDPNIHQWPWR